MSARHYWYGMIKKIIMYPHILDDENPKAKEIFLNAIDEADRQTRDMPNGELRLKAVEDILIKKTRTYEGVSQELFYSKDTVKSWVAGYINLVGILSGL